MKSEIKKQEKPYAIVIGLDHINGIQTARILARHEIPVIAIAGDPDHHCCRTKVCERILIADKNSVELIECLEALGPTLDKKAVLYPCEDTSVLLISRHRKRLESWFHVILPEPEIVDMLMDKVSLYAHAQEKGLPIPATHFVSSKEDAQQAAAELTFPCAVKPPNSAVPGWE